MKKLLLPFGEIDKKTRLGVVIFWIILLLLLFEVGHSKVVPSPTKVANSLLEMVQTQSFYEDLVASLITTFKAMTYSILLTVVIVYSSTMPLFRPLAELVSKCRYLTITGLVFVFTMISNDIGQLKIYLLIFGITPFFVTSFLSIVDGAPPEEKLKSYVNKNNRWQTLWETIVVGKLDMLFEVMRQNFAISWMMITTVEAYAITEGGVGTMMIKSNRVLNLSSVFATLIVVLILGLIFDWGLTYLRTQLFPYLKIRK